MHHDRFGEWLKKARTYDFMWKWVFFSFLLLLVLLNVFILPHHPHFELEHYPGFWAAFSLLGTVIMTFVLKKIVFPIISRKEEDYDRD
ncbi:hypothetical protein [Desulfovibrio inopinatus]|uniref:hypothetical protein n=1 Tax=Desulfovibrio inopinatus TaxID=102109 RepID=UPI0004158AFE|nr:hypothetical protein [Desulfovibrio inopinatus]